MSDLSSKNNTCTLQQFYEGMKNIDPTIIKKQSFQQGEIFVIMKSLSITRKMLNEVCQASNIYNLQCENNLAIDTLIIESNQILTLGYRNIQNSYTVTLNIEHNIKLILNNSATLIIFKENIFINNGLLIIINSSLCLESKHEAKFINNGEINFKNSQFFGTGMIINNHLFKVTGYSKIYLGRLKEEIKSLEKEKDELKICDENEEDESYLYDFGQNSTKFINAGELLISGYSLFDLYGYFINGKSDLSETFLIDTEINNEINNISKYRKCSLVFLKSNSKFLFTLGENSTLDSFTNDTNGLIISENNTYIRFKISKNVCVDHFKRKIITNRGIMILNGETYFISVNFENYGIVKNTIHNINSYIENGVTFGNNFNYSKIIFINNKCEYIPSIKNIGNRSLIQISATSTLQVFGYNLINQGTIGIGVSRDNIGQCDNLSNFTFELNLDSNEDIIIEDESNKELIRIIDEIKINGEFLFGFMEPNNCINITFKNWGNIYCFLKSRCIIGYNSSSIINSKRQVMLLNYGLIRNWGYLKICRFSEIINLPSFPFNVNCKLYGIINGSNICLRPCQINCNTLCKVENNSDKDTRIQCNFNLNAILIVARPIPSVGNNVFTGGFIKSENKIFTDCCIVKNHANGVIITWFGYEEEDFQTCNISYGIDDKNLKTSSTGKIVPLPSPSSFENWPKNCLSKFLEEQSLSFNFDFKLT